MESQEYEGSVTAMKISPWLASEDFMGRGRVKLIIEKVFKHEKVVSQDGRIEKNPVFALKFKKLDKQLWLNATNRKALSIAFGSSVKEWQGKVIEVGVVNDRRKPGTKNEKTNGLQVYATAGQPPTEPITETQTQPEQA